MIGACILKKNDGLRHQCGTNVMNERDVTMIQIKNGKVQKCGRFRTIILMCKNSILHGGSEVHAFQRHSTITKINIEIFK